MCGTRLFCLPYAGGSSLFYRPLGKLLKSSVDLIALDYPGHGARMGNDLCVRLDDLLDDVYAQMRKKNLDEPFAVLGYSLGATVAYHLFFYLQAKGLTPQHVFFAANTPPYVPNDGVPSPDLDDDEFLDQITALGGMSQEVLACRELLDLFLPIMRADVRLEEAGSVTVPRTIDVSMTVMYGNEDDTNSEMGEWCHCAGASCDLRALDGGHFFMLDHYADVAQIINHAL